MPVHTQIGDNLDSLLLQEGWTVTDDSYGLYTGTCVFLLDTEKSYPNSEDAPIPGQPHPIAAWNFLRVDKIQRRALSAYVTQFTVTYVGIQIPAGEGAIGITSPNVEDTSGTSTEPIENHENFYGNPNSIVTYDGGAIAGVGSGSDDPTIQPVYNESGMHIAPNDTLYEGDNGACFIQATGGKFMGFLNPAYPKFYGKKSYISPVTSWTGVLYTTDLPTAQKLKDYNCCTTKTNMIDTIEILPAFYGESFEATDESAQLLFMNVGMKKFAGVSSAAIYRITYTIRFSAEGFPGQVYPSKRIE